MSVRLLEWSSIFEVGVESIDADHREILNAINRFGTECMNGISVEIVYLIIDEIIIVTINHFKKEEKYLRDNNFPSKIHVEEHKKLLANLEQIRNEILVSIDNNNYNKIFHKLEDWFVKHTVGLDSNIKAYFDDRRS